MRGLFGALLALAASALLAAPASAHHSQAMFDTTREVLFNGTVVRFDWVNPHMYLIIETNGPDGKPMRVEGEGLATTQARADGLNRDALKPGMRVIMRANPNRGGPGKQVRVLDVTTQNGELHPFYAASTRGRTLKPANSLPRRWAPTRLRYEITVEDPAYLTKPATMAQQWDHRPDLNFSPASEACDPKEAARYRESVPK